MLTFKHINKTFGDIQALKDVSFEVEKGEFVFITGHSGAGKSTLLKLILREILPDSGQVIFDGHNIVSLDPKEVPLLRQQIGVVFQDLKVLPERTVRENVEVALAVCDIDQAQWHERVDQVLRLVGLLERAEYFPAQLSGGELQRVSLARALVVNPKIILADEPTGNLDWDISKGIIEIFEKINKEGKTIIMATHNEMIVDKFKKRVIKIKNGEITAGGGLKEKKEEKVSEEKKEEPKEEKEKPVKTKSEEEAPEEIKKETEPEKKEEGKKIKLRVEEV